MSFVKNTLIIFIAEIISYPLAFIISIIIARTLGTDGMGIYSIVTMMMGWSLLFGSLGMSAAVPYFIGKKKETIDSIVSTSFIFSLITGFIIIIFIFLGSTNIIDLIFHNKIGFEIILLVCLTIPFGFLYSNMNYILQGLRSYNKYGALMILQQILLLILLCILLLFLKIGVFGAIFAYTLATIGIGIFAVKISKVKIKKRYFNLKLLKDMVNFGWKPYIGSITITLNYTLDLLLVGILLTTSEVGIYSVAILFSKIIWIIPDAIQTILFPEIAHSSSKEKSKNLTVITYRHTFYLSIISALALYVLAFLLIPLLYTQSFSPALLPLIILLIGSIFFSVVKTLSSALFGEGKSEIGLLLAAPAVIINLILSVLLIPLYGIEGAAVASTLGYIASFLVVLKETYKTYNIQIKELFIINRSDIVIYIDLIKKIV